MDPAQAIDEAGRGKATPFQSRLQRPVRHGSGKQLTTAQIAYRGWAAQASLAQINASPLAAKKAAGGADLVVANATHWVAKSPAAERLGGVLSRPTVRNMRLEVTKQTDHPVARFTRGIPSLTAEKGTVGAKHEAKWFLDQVSSSDGQAFVAV
jgi:hypothetical protein